MTSISHALSYSVGSCSNTLHTFLPLLHPYHTPFMTAIVLDSFFLHLFCINLNEAPQLLFCTCVILFIFIIIFAYAYIGML